MNVKKIVYSVIVVGMLNPTGLSVFAETTTADLSSNLEKESYSLDSESSKAFQETTTTSQKQDTNNILSGWQLDTQSEQGVARLTGFNSKEIKNVVIPTVEDLKATDASYTSITSVKIDRSALIAAAQAANDLSGTLGTSSNGPAIVYDNTDFSIVFAKCQNLTSIDLSNLDTSKVTTMKQSFYKCSNLGSLNLVNFNTSQVTDMSSLFANCQSLQNLDLSSFNTAQVTDMSGMFQDCNRLGQLNIKNFDTSNVRTMFGMFLSCNTLSTIDLSSFNTARVTDMSGMFSGMYKLPTLDLSNFTTETVTSMVDMFKGSMMTHIILDSFNTTNVTNMAGMFSGCTNLSTLDLSPFNTMNVTNMASMFSGCQNLKTLNVTSLNTEKVTSMGGMFKKCQSLEKLDLTNFNTSNVLTIESMFEDCQKLSSLNVTAFDTSKVISMGKLFSNCKNLGSVQIAKFDTSNVNCMTGMFNNCSKLDKLDLSNFDTTKVTAMNAMFNNCQNLSEIDVHNFNTSNVATMERMFADCNRLSGIDLENFDTSKANTANMFTVSNQTIPFLIYVKTDTKLKAYNYEKDGRLAPITVNSGEQGIFKENEQVRRLLSSSVTTAPVAQFNPLRSNPEVQAQLNTMKQDLQKQDKNYVFTNWNYLEGSGTVDVMKKVNATYTAIWKPIFTLTHTTLTKPIGTKFDEKEIRDNIKQLLNSDGEDVTSSEKKAVVLKVTNAAGVTMNDLDKLTAQAGTYTIRYQYGGAEALMTLIVPISDCTVTFKSAGNGTLGGMTMIKVKKGSKVTSLPSTKPHTGFKFDAWYNTSNKKVDPRSVVINQNTTFTAKFTEIKVAMYRVYNPNSGEHFYTRNINERNSLKKAGWRDEKIGWYAPEMGNGAPVYRLYNKNAGDHHFTTNKAEKDNLKRVGWKDEGIGWYSKGSIPLYRQYNPNAKAGSHNYTTNKSENDLLVKAGWRAEGISWYALAK